MRVGRKYFLICHILVVSRNIEYFIQTNLYRLYGRLL